MSNFAVFAADTSKFATNNQPVPDEVIEELKRVYRVKLLWPGAWHGVSGYDAVAETLRRARNHGLMTGTYVALTRRGTAVEDVNAAHRLIGDEEWSKLSFVAIDMEWGNPKSDSSVAGLDDLKKAAQRIIELRQRPALYTARWWWVDRLGNPTIPDDLPLINAFYDQNPDIDFHSNRYGGSNVRLVGEQYTGSTRVKGVDFDFSVFDADWLAIGPASGAEGLRILQKAWQEDMADTIRGAVSLYQMGINPAALALFGIYQTDKAKRWSSLIRSANRKT
jgi:hypothetical protein